MKNVRLKTLKLRNFKGIKELDINFDCQYTNIYGKNATGKTTINDSFQWLLFGKDSSGSADFNLKPKDANGVVLHNLEYSVEAVLELNGTQLSLKKVLKEKYTKKRGSSTEEFTGHTTDYFIDDIPKSKKEFDEMVDMVIDKEVFQLITDPLFFNDDKRYGWKNRRKLLIDICGDVSDEDVFNQDAELSDLKGLIGNKSVDDYKLMIQSKMKPINDELKAIPIKINEAKLAIPSETGIVDEAEYELLKTTIEAKEQERLNALNGGAVAEKEVEIVKLQNRKLLIEDEISPALSKRKKNISEYEQKAEELKRKQVSIELEIKDKESQSKSNLEKRSELKKEYINLIETKFDENSTLCTMCGQTLPQDKISVLIEEFNINKSNKLEAINNEGMALKEAYEKMILEIDELNKQLCDVSSAIRENDVMFEENKNALRKETAEFELDKQSRIEKIVAEIKKIEEEIVLIQANEQSPVEAIDAELKVLREKKEKMDALISNNVQKERQEQRIQELEAQEKNLSREYQEMDKALYLIEKFIRTKVSMLSTKINGYFKLCNFKLFEMQINGGLAECCEVTVNGVPYADLNNAMKINSGLDCINTICDFTNSYAPIFIDNAESVNEPIKTQSQQIRLYVTDSDNELRIEH